MARLSQEWREQHNLFKFKKVDKNGNVRSVRQRNRCPLCGRPRAYMRKFDMCRICFRNMAVRGEIPGVVKSSW
ncbi:MAG: type Z 30S ribosomal protein S14 [Polyangia bacterium]|jgi:small subunit ribosomal protein S14